MQRKEKIGNKALLHFCLEKGASKAWPVVKARLFLQRVFSEVPSEALLADLTHALFFASSSLTYSKSYKPAMIQKLVRST